MTQIIVALAKLFMEAVLSKKMLNILTLLLKDPKKAAKKFKKGLKKTAKEYKGMADSFKISGIKDIKERIANFSQIKEQEMYDKIQKKFENVQKLDEKIDDFSPSKVPKMLKDQLLNTLLKKPAKIIERIKKLSPKDKKDLEDATNGANNKAGVDISLTSSWLEWGVWVADKINPNVGTLTLSMRGTPYTFGVAGYSRTYPKVPYQVWKIIKQSPHAGTSFWNYYYGLTSMSNGRIKNWKGPTV